MQSPTCPFQIRSMAAAAICCILEGPPQRAFMAVAEARDAAAAAGAAAAPSSSLSQRPLRGFTTLSSSLGRAVVATHQGLLQAGMKETIPAVAQVTLRALCVLMVGAPYERLPASLLPDTIEVSRVYRVHQALLLFRGVMLHCKRQQ